MKAINLSLDEVQTLQVALSFQNQELQKAHRRAIEAGMPYQDVRGILELCGKLIDLNNALQNQI